MAAADFVDPEKVIGESSFEDWKAGSNYGALD